MGVPENCDCREGEIFSIETAAKYQTPERAYIVEMERYQAKVGEREDIIPYSLRAMMVLHLKTTPGMLCTDTQSP